MLYKLYKLWLDGTVGHFFINLTEPNALVRRIISQESIFIMFYSSNCFSNDHQTNIFGKEPYFIQTHKTNFYTLQTPKAIKHTNNVI